MFKSILTNASAGLVLTVGLTSCAPDAKQGPTRDVYNPRPPEIVQKGSRLSIRNWSQQSKKSADLNDELDFSGSDFDQMSVQSSCTVNGVASQQSFSFDNSKKIQFFQIFPQALLPLRLQEKFVECVFKLQLINANRSKHLFFLDQIHVTDRLEPSLQILDDQRNRMTLKDDKLPILKVGDLHSYKLRSPYTGDEQSQVLCQSMEFTKVKVTQLYDLAAVDWANPIPMSNDQIKDFDYNPIQSCRIVIYNQNTRLAMSSLFRVQFNREPLTTKLVFERGPTCTNDKKCHSLREMVASGTDLEMQRWEVSNPGEAPRFVRIDRHNLVVWTRISFFYHKSEKNTHYQYEARIPKLLVKLVLPKNVKLVEQTAKFWTVYLEAGQALQINVNFRGSLHDIFPAGVKGMALAQREGPRIEELTESGEAMTTSRLNGKMNWTYLFDRSFDMTKLTVWPNDNPWR